MASVAPFPFPTSSLPWAQEFTVLLPWLPNVEACLLNGSLNYNQGTGGAECSLESLTPKLTGFGQNSSCPYWTESPSFLLAEGCPQFLEDLRALTEGISLMQLINSASQFGVPPPSPSEYLLARQWYLFIFAIVCAPGVSHKCPSPSRKSYWKVSTFRSRNQGNYLNPCTASNGYCHKSRSLMDPLQLGHSFLISGLRSCVGLLTDGGDREKLGDSRRFLKTQRLKINSKSNTQ